MDLFASIGMELHAQFWPGLAGIWPGMRLTQQPADLATPSEQVSRPSRDVPAGYVKAHADTAKYRAMYSESVRWGSPKSPMQVIVSSCGVIF